VNRNIKLIDAVISLHDIARLVEKETTSNILAADIRRCADRLHEVSLVENQVIDIINKAKE
jgi:hypothetical protein